MTGQRNKKQEHKNEKLQGSHWIMEHGPTGDSGSRGAPCRSHDITSCHAAHVHVCTKYQL